MTDSLLPSPLPFREIGCQIRLVRGLNVMPGGDGALSMHVAHDPQGGFMVTPLVRVDGELRLAGGGVRRATMDQCEGWADGFLHGWLELRWTIDREKEGR